jgi:hypothetical protein
MASELKAYIIALCRQAPLSWRRWSFIMSAGVSIATIFFLLLGWRLDAVSGTVTACGVSAIAVLDILVLFPYQLWKANTAEIKSLRNQLTPRLKFTREIRKEGGAGRYCAYMTVRNSSLSDKMTNCRCEIAVLEDASGQVVERNIGLRTKGQLPQELGGRFNLDQGSEKEIPLFILAQLEEPRPGLYVVTAGAQEMRLEYDVYTARIRAYGDSGQPDEITVQVNCRAVTFELVT